MTANESHLKKNIHFKKVTGCWRVFTAKIKLKPPFIFLNTEGMR